VIDAALRKANNKRTVISIAFTQGPGLMGSLLLEVHLQNLLHSFKIPLIAVNHMQACFSSFY
jgi:tRNA A37 threonylcarbamoyltransferase TsaD